MCHRIGRPPISTIGFGRTPVSSLSRVPRPPARITAFISVLTPHVAYSLHLSVQYTACSLLCILSTPDPRMTDSAEQLRQQILQLCARYFEEAFPPSEFVPGQSAVPVSGKVIDAGDLGSVVDSALDCWFTTGRFAEDFERKLARFVGVRSASLTNSGSSANLVAVSALTSPKLGDRRLQPGDEVITVAAGFPTTLNPILQNRLVPVFVDITVPGYEIDVTQLEAARSDRTRAIVLAHTLGNVFDLDAITAFAQKYNLWLVEDCCD